MAFRIRWDSTCFKKRVTPGITFLDQIGTIFSPGALDELGKPKKDLIRPPNLAKLLKKFEQKGFNVEQAVWDAIGQAASGLKK